MSGDFERMKAGCVRVRVLAGHLRAALTDLRGLISPEDLADAALHLVELTLDVNRAEANAQESYLSGCSGAGRRAEAMLPTSGPRLAGARVSPGDGKMAAANDHTLEEDAG